VNLTQIDRNRIVAATLLTALLVPLAWLASGRLHGFWARRIACWDAAAGFLLVREAGGAVGGFAAGADAIPLDDPAFVAAGSPELLRGMRGLLAG
jgi:myo-inositol-1(or 4)-monophosphatase